MTCISRHGRCFSPVACGAFGYCREVNIRGEVSREEAEAAGYPPARSNPSTVKDAPPRSS